MVWQVPIAGMVGSDAVATESPWLSGDSINAADVAISPFLKSLPRAAGGAVRPRILAVYRTLPVSGGVDATRRENPRHRAHPPVVSVTVTEQTMVSAQP